MSYKISGYVTIPFYNLAYKIAYEGYLETTMVISNKNRRWTWCLFQERFLDNVHFQEWENHRYKKPQTHLIQHLTLLTQHI